MSTNGWSGNSLKQLLVDGQLVHLLLQVETRRLYTISSTGFTYISTSLYIVNESPPVVISGQETASMSYRSTHFLMFILATISSLLMINILQLFLFKLSSHNQRLPTKKFSISMCRVFYPA